MATATKEAPSKNGAGAAALPPQFKSFNRANAVGRNNGELPPGISVNAGGNFRLNAALVARLNLKAGAGVLFHFDGTTDQWYLERDDKEGLPLRDEKKGALQTNSSAVLRAMQEQFPNGKTRGRMLVSPEPQRIAHRLLYPVLTSSLVHLARNSKA